MTQASTVYAKLRVIYGDTDQMGVVYYANYFRYFEFSRSEYFRARGGNYAQLEQEGFGLPVVSAHCDYKRPAKYDQMLIISVHVAELRRASLRFAYEVKREEDSSLLATGHTVHACVGPTGIPTGLPESVVKLLRPS